MSANKILLVDDSKSARYALRLLLQKHNFEVDTAESAESALEKVKENVPDAIFMDHLMPGMNGFEALEALKADQATAHIPVVMCTSNDDEPYQRQAKEKGALGILPKPATPEKLSAMLEAINAAMVQPAAPAAPAAAEPIEAPAAAPAAAIDMEAIAALVREQIAQAMENDVRPLLDQTLNSSLQALKQDIADASKAPAEQQVREWIEQENVRLREEIASGPEADMTGVEEKLNQEVAQLRGELVKMETEHAHITLQKIRDEVLPDAIARHASQIEQQILERVESRLESATQSLPDDMARNPHLVRQLSEAAETAAERKAGEVAKAHSKDIAEAAAADKASEVTDSLIHSAESAIKRMNFMALGAALVGILAAAVVYFIK